MNRNIFRPTKMQRSLTIVYLFASILMFKSVWAQNASMQGIEGGFKYTYVPNDPLKVRIYTLPNGLKVYLSVYKASPRVYTQIAVRAGSKNDPSYATGLAHYLEHMCFKGSSHLGSLNWVQEKPMLAQIENLYEQYRNTKDSINRKKIYHQIDSISGKAAKYVVPNEYDQVMSQIGAKGTNAYTWVDQTVYVNDVPANELNRWIQIEGERFSEMVPRLFHTELEAVYEEKNRSLDQDNNKMWEKMFAMLYPNHPYGTQTTIGTVEHLQNPSIKEIKKFFDTWYVPNNMAICLSGDLDPTKTMQAIYKAFGMYKTKPLPAYHSAALGALTKETQAEVFGPSAESVNLGFRFPGVREPASCTLELMAKVLFNGQAGLIDLNLNQKQKILKGSAFAQRFAEHSMLLFGGSPREGQSLKEVQEALLGQIKALKEGQFDESLLEAVVNNAQLTRMKELEDNQARVETMVSAFVYQQSWEEAIGELDTQAKISKSQLVGFAKEYLQDAYVVIYKRNGKDTTVVKVEKPIITPVTINRDKHSTFYKTVVSETTPRLKPVYIDFQKEIGFKTLGKDLPVLYKRNIENKLFDLYYVLDLGSAHDPLLPIAIKYFNYLGTDSLSNEAIKKAMYRLGCTYQIYANDDRIYFNLSGLDKNFEQGLHLFEHVIRRVKPDPEALIQMKEGILKSRIDAKKNKSAILQALVNYVKYGPINPTTDIISEEALKNLRDETLMATLHRLMQLPHRILYYGPRTWPEVQTPLLAQHPLPAQWLPMPEEKQYPLLPRPVAECYWTHFDMVQTEMVLLHPSVVYDTQWVATTGLFNEYFGGGMGSLVFQEIRESKALAYASSSRYQLASKSGKNNFVVSYIGTQSDKLPEAYKALNVLLDSMPLSPSLFKNAKEAQRTAFESQRIIKAGVLLEYETLRRLGLNQDLRKQYYQKTLGLGLKDIVQFHDKMFRKKPYQVLLIGHKDKIKFEPFAEKMAVKELTLREIFGY